MTKIVALTAKCVVAATCFLCGASAGAHGEQCNDMEMVGRAFKQSEFVAPNAVIVDIMKDMQEACVYAFEGRSYGKARRAQTLEEVLSQYLIFLADKTVTRGPTLKGLLLEAVDPGGWPAKSSKKYPRVAVQFNGIPDRVFVNGQPVRMSGNCCNVPVGDVSIVAEKDGTEICRVELQAEVGENYSTTCVIE